MLAPPAAHKPPAPHADAVEIGISFAGDQKTRVAHWKDLPVDSLERWPLALAALLRSPAYNFQVVEYRYQQSRDEHEKHTGRKDYLDMLITRDFMFIFLSWPYLESPWCMYEFLKVHGRCKEGKQDLSLVRTGAFKEAVISQTNLKQRHPACDKHPIVYFADFWSNWLKEFNTFVKDAAKTDKTSGVFAYEKKAALIAYSEWAKCVSEPASLAAIEAVLHGGWTINPVDRNPSEGALEKWADDLEKNTKRREVILEYAAAAWRAVLKWQPRPRPRRAQPSHVSRRVLWRSGAARCARRRTGRMRGFHTLTASTCAERGCASCLMPMWCWTA